MKKGVACLFPNLGTKQHRTIHPASRKARKTLVALSLLQNKALFIAIIQFSVTELLLYKLFMAYIIS